MKSVSSLALYTAQRKGFLARENIDLEVIRLPGVHHMIEGLDKNTVDVSHTATPYLIEGVLKGSGTVGIVGGPANTIFSVIAKPEIKSFADLKGKMFAMSLPVDTISIASRLLLAKHGLKETDYRTTELIGTQTRAKCLIDGECDAVPLGQPDDIVFAAKGFTKLGDFAGGDPGAAVQRDRRAPRLGGARTRTWRCASPAPSATPIASCAIRRTATRSPRILAETTDAPPDVARAMLAFYYEPDRGVMPQAGGDQPARRRQGDRAARRHRRAQGAAARGGAFVDLQYLKAAGLQ